MHMPAIPVVFLNLLNLSLLQTGARETVEDFCHAVPVISLGLPVHKLQKQFHRLLLLSQRSLNTALLYEDTFAL
jgi:hypothetical protein